MENIGYALIGTPDGLQMRTKGIFEDRRIGGYVDLPNRLIKLINPKDEILSVVREYEGSDLITYFILYRYALEIDRNRTGTFYGSVVALKNCKAPGSIIYMMLIELAAQVAAYTQRQTGKFLANLDNIPFREPYHLGFLESSISPIRHAVPAEKDRACFVYGPKIKFSRSAFIEAALTDESLARYQKCFFSESPEVDKYVREQRGLEYFTEQKSTEEHLISFGTGENVDFQLNLMPTILLLEKQKKLDNEITRLRQDNQELKKRVAELEKEKLSHRETEPQKAEPNQGARGQQLSVSTNLAASGRHSNEAGIDSSSELSPGGPAGKDEIERRFILSRVAQSIRRFFNIRRIIAFTFSLLALLLIGLVAILILDKDIPYISDLLPNRKQQDTPQELANNASEPRPSRAEEGATLPEEMNMSEAQQRLWIEIEAYLGEIEPNLNYDGAKMDRYKTRMNQEEVEKMPQYQRFMDVYNNFLGSGLPHDMLVKKSIIPEGRLQDISIDIISQQAPLTTGKLAAYIAEKCPNIPSDFTPPVIERTIINANPGDVNRQTGEVNIKGRIVFYIPNSATCNLN